MAGLSFFRLKHISSIVRLSSSAIQCEKAGGYGDDKIKSKIMVKREYEAMKKADAVFGPSKMIAEETENIINKKITIIETPFLLKNIQLDYTLFDKTLRNKKYILFFGSIGLIKGVGTIANMIYPFLEEHRDCYFVFVGKKLNNQINSLNIWDYLMKNAAEHGSRIIHFEPLKHELLFPIIKNAACVVLPSITDNFPNTCIEAMANGKIVIGTQGNGFEQLINHEKSGYLIKVNDHLSLHSIINKIFALNERDKAEIEKNAISRIKLLSPDSIMPQIEEIYQLAIKLNDNKKTTKIYF
ncbi:MAG: glycosyltransferase [Bacteroidia bacterium]|nr:glycosyltransferase [Bacteroidia bacterium]